MEGQEIQGIKREIDRSNDHNGCYHCGAEFDEVVVEAFEHRFCCEGCKTVFEILDVNGLNTYYGIESTPGIKLSKSVGNKYAFLDSEEVREGIIDFQDGGVSSVRFYVPKIHCSSCIWLLENLHRLHSGVAKATVNFLKKEVYIVFHDKDITLRELVELMSSVGYEPTISLDNFKGKKEQSSSKTFFYKLGIAGFSFGNIMLLSFPEYFDTADYLDDSFSKLFGYLNIFLATPVFLYSASDYYVSAYKAIRNRYFNIDFPISVGIFTLYFRSAFEIISGSGPGFMDSFTMFVFLLLVGKWYQNRTYQALSFERDYKSYFPLAVVRLRDNEESAVPVGNLKIGDTIILRNNEIMPTDGVLLSDNSQIDYSFVTGESQAITKTKGDKLFAGGRQLGMSAKILVKSEVSQSYLTRLWNQDTFTKDEAGYQTIVNNVSKYFTVFVIIVALATLFFWFGSGASMALKIFTSVLIIACPCALALTLPFSYGNTMTILGRNRFYTKNSETIEKLALVDSIVFDKTGTLTQSGDEKIDFVGNGLTAEEKSWVKSMVSHSTHPLSKVIYNFLSESQVVAVSDFDELPSKGLVGRINDTMIKVGSRTFTGYIGTDKQDLSSRVYIRVGDHNVGYFLIRKRYREGITGLIESLKGNNYDLHLISGDNEAELNNLSGLFESAQLHFNQTPQSKLEYVQKLQKDGKNVLMIGDGLNDAGALKQADVGIAISDDVYNFTPACDAILDATRFNDLLLFLGFTKSTLKIVKWSFLISLTYNTVGMGFAVYGLVTPLFAAILMPISSITVVSFITISIKLLARNRNL